MENAPQTRPAPDVAELLELLNEAMNLGLMFDAGTAYIRRAYVEHQAAIVERIRQANIAHGYKPVNRYGEPRNR